MHLKKKKQDSSTQLPIDVVFSGIWYQRGIFFHNGFCVLASWLAAAPIMALDTMASNAARTSGAWGKRVPSKVGDLGMFPDPEF